MSRIVGRQMLLGDIEKEHMRKLVRRIEGFTGVRVLTYSIMTNHVHLLLEEPDRNQDVPDNIFWERMRSLYLSQELDELRELWSEWPAEEVAKDRRRYVYRMHDISEFMKQLKQRFSRWYNRRQSRTGALWDARFKSVLVEPGTPLRTVAAYIEMNPVRAGMVAEPQHYRFGGFGEAMGGQEAAQKGIQRIIASMDTEGWQSVSTHYLERILMYDEVRRHPERADTDHDMLREQLGHRLNMTDGERLRYRSRYFTDGLIIGSKGFVEAFFSENQDQFGAKRTSGARRVKGGWRGIYALRELVDWE